MKRFSPKQTLSNITTRVRETVKFMNTKSTAMILALSLLGVAGSIPVVAADKNASDFFSQLSGQSRVSELEAAITKQCGPGGDKELCDTAKKGYKKALSGGSDDAQLQRCNAARERVDKTSSRASESCRDAGYGALDRCYDMVTTCEKADAALDEYNEEEGGGGGEYCNKVLANNCSAIPNLNTGRDYRQEKKDAETDRKEAKKELDGLLDDQRKSRKELADKQRELLEAQQNDAMTARDQDRKIAEGLENALEAMADKQKQAFENAQSQYEQMEVAVINMRQEAIAANDAVATAEEQLQTICRAFAEKKYAEAEKTRLAALAAKKKNLGSSTAVSGSTARTRSTTTRARAIDYTAFLSECTSGNAAEGMAAINQISAAKRAKSAKDKLLADKSALLDKQRASIADKLKAMEADATTQQQKLIEKVNQQKAALAEKQALIAQQNQTRMQAFQQEQAAEMQSLQQKIDTANGELMKTQQEASLATSRISCMGRSAQKSESLRDKGVAGFTSAQSNVDAVSAACFDQIRYCTGLDESVNSETQKALNDFGGSSALDVCAVVGRIKKGTDATGKKRSTFKKEIDIESGGGKSTR